MGTMILERDKHGDVRIVDGRRKPGRGRNGSWRFRIRHVPETWPKHRLMWLVRKRNILESDLFFDQLIYEYGTYRDVADAVEGIQSQGEQRAIGTKPVTHGAHIRSGEQSRPRVINRSTDT
jgi:hypothetical protein